MSRFEGRLANYRLVPRGRQRRWRVGEVYAKSRAGGSLLSMNASNGASTKLGSSKKNQTHDPTVPTSLRSDF